MTVHKFESSRKTTVEINEYKHIKRKNMKNNPQKKILRQDGFPIGAEMAKKRYSSAGTTTPFLKQLILTILLFAILPVTALAAENAPTTLYVGGQVLNVVENSYWTTNENGKLTTCNATENWNVAYDAGSATLTLKEATITENKENYLADYGAGIYAYSSSGALSLNIVVTGSNKVSGLSGIYTYSTAGTASVTISGSGSLIAEGSNIGADSGIFIYSGSANAELTITGVDVTATNTDPSGKAIRLQPSASASATLAVNSGSLTASGAPGIDYQFGTGTTGSGTPSLTVSGNAIVRVNGGITNRSTTDLQIGAGSSGSNGGIVWNGTEGTVYGDVTLQENLEIGEGESLTIPQGASLNTNGKLTVNGGTLNGTPSGDVTYKVTGVSLNKGSLTLDVGESKTLYATVQPDNATKQNVTWSSNNANVAIVEDGKVTAVAEGEATITVTTEDGSFTATCTVTVAHTCTWGDVSYEWSKDDEGNQTCTATRTCKKDETHTESATATVTSEPTKAPTCTEMGETTYTATFSVDWAEEQITTEDIPANGHNYVNGTCTVCGADDPDYVAPEPEPEPEPEPTYYRVDLRPVEGATVILSADEVEEGGTLTFTIEIAEGYVADDLMVTVSQGIGKAVEVKPDEAGVYTVKEVDGLVTITVYGVTEEPATAIERVETLRIYAAEGILHVETPTRQRVTIVSMGGALIADGEQEGARIYRDLNAGVYIVRVGDYATKVRVE